MSDDLTNKNINTDKKINDAPPGNREQGDDRTLIKQARVTRFSENRNLIIILGVIAIVAVLALVMWSLSDAGGSKTNVTVKSEEGDDHGDEHGEEGEHEEGLEVELSPEAIAAAGIEVVTVSQQPAVSLMRVTGTIEPNQQQTQQVTPLVSGRLERVNVVLGDRVRAGVVLAVISSPEIAEMHGKLHEAETRLALAERNYERVQLAENRVGVIQAKAKLDEADATLRRTRRLVELGAGAGKDLIAAEAAQKTAKAEYDYHNNISVNREVQEARAEVETSRVEVSHLRNSLRAFGAAMGATGHSAATPHDTSVIALTAPASGLVTERLANAGAGIEAGKPLFTISNISTLWVIANVPESQIGSLRVGTPAEIRSAALGEAGVSGRVTYIDPILNEETRTARVRVEMANPGERLKVGMFVEVGFEAGAAPSQAVGEELLVPEEAVQRLGDRTVVFMPKESEEGHFKVRDVELGGSTGGFRRVISGLAQGDRVVTKGSFTLKTQLMKGAMGEHGH